MMIDKMPTGDRITFQLAGIKKLSMVTAAALVMFGIIGKAQIGTAQTITFENDPVGPQPNGFQSAESPLLSFSDSIGADLSITNFPPNPVVFPAPPNAEAIGNGLVTGVDDFSSLNFNFSVPVTSLSFLFGNDQNVTTLDGDAARLDIFNNGTAVNSFSVPLNRNDVADQTISTNVDQIFNSATFTYVDAGGNAIELREVVDNVAFQLVPGPNPQPGPGPNPQPVPEPSSILGLATFGAFGAITMLKRKRQKCKN